VAAERMSFILAEHRRTVEEAAAAFGRYRDYLAANRSRFPPGAYELAIAPWYYNPHDHRCPHDAWLDSVLVSEPATGERSEHRTVAIRVRLLGAYHDGHIELTYPQVFQYHLSLDEATQGHRDWRFDEFRLSQRGHLIHEIEWNGADHLGRWLIEAADVTYAWQPSSGSGGAAT
jgi:hypothetical protein